MSQSQTIKTPEQERSEKIFLDYVRRRPDSIGKRFILIHVEEHGIQAFEDFWDKMRDAFSHGIKTMDLTPEESKSLARAIAPGNLTRRKWMGMTVGGALTAFAALDGLGEWIKYDDKPQRRRLRDQVEDFGEFLGNLAIPAVVGISGLTLMGVSDLWYEMKLDKLVEGDRGLEHVSDLVRSLDQMFLPVEAAMSESMLKQDKGNRLER